MNEQTRARLAAINKDFYDSVAEEFSASRDHPWPGWEQVLSVLAPERLRVLDVGCGNGRFAGFLSERWKGPLAYLGIDSNEVLLTHAVTRAGQRPDRRRHLQFEQREILSARFRSDPPPGPYDLVVLFGVMHHIPSFEARRALLALLGAQLASGGLLVATFWRFAEDERLRTRRLSWEDYNARAAAPIDLGQLESGDHLLRFGARPGAEGRVPRYCHFTDDAETERLIACTEKSSDLALETCFRADGRSGDLNEYLIFRRLAEVSP